MARRIVPLSEVQVRKAKPREKDYKLFDGGGLFLLVTPAGGKHWKLKYRFDGKERKYSIGSYPELRLSEVRERREDLRGMVQRGIDPNEARRADSKALRASASKSLNTFYRVSQLWWEDYSDRVSPKYHDRLLGMMTNYLYPFIREQPIEEISRLDVVDILEHLRRRGIHETARRTALLLGQIYKYAVTHEYTAHNIIADIDVRQIVGKKIVRHHPAPTDPQEIAALLMAIDGYSGDYTTQMALRMLPYLFVRSYNIRHMEWSEIDTTAQTWRIPASKMKMKADFTLPLPRQVITLLEELRYQSTSTRYVFPSLRNDGKPLSNNTLSGALRRLGYAKDEITPHGFRAIFSTTAYSHISGEDGHGYHREVIEACLAHKERDQTVSAYNHATYEELKRGLVQWYADYLDGIKHHQQRV